MQWYHNIKEKLIVYVLFSIVRLTTYLNSVLSVSYLVAPISFGEVIIYPNYKRYKPVFHITNDAIANTHANINGNINLTFMVTVLVILVFVGLGNGADGARMDESGEVLRV